MHTLYPSLMDDDNAPMNADGDGSVLSPELREHFDAMKALNNSRMGERQNVGESNENEKKRKDRSSDSNLPDDEHEELETKRLQMATKTALVVEREMSRLQNGIAELEALLEQQEGGARQRLDAFPDLPPVVTVVRDEEEDGVQGK
mmetsp:Transcript_15905/g.23431  ORF Transcript_15905/g.23431 Transcript_15905/m.23431 type:complete len:146 (+) Transcript_15905:2875-3312(+)